METAVAAGIMGDQFVGTCFSNINCVFQPFAVLDPTNSTDVFGTKLDVDTFTWPVKSPEIFSFVVVVSDAFAAMIEVNCQDNSGNGVRLAVVGSGGRFFNNDRQWGRRGTGWSSTVHEGIVCREVTCIIGIGQDNQLAILKDFGIDQVTATAIGAQNNIAVGQLKPLELLVDSHRGANGGECIGLAGSAYIETVGCLETHETGTGVLDDELVVLVALVVRQVGPKVAIRTDEFAPAAIENTDS